MPNNKTARTESPEKTETEIHRSSSWVNSFRERSKQRNDVWDEDLAPVKVVNTGTAICRRIEFFDNQLGIRRIFLIRHGQSEGNINKKILTTVADHAISLSTDGKLFYCICSF